MNFDCSVKFSERHLQGRNDKTEEEASTRRAKPTLQQQQQVSNRKDRFPPGGDHPFVKYTKRSSARHSKRFYRGNVFAHYIARRRLEFNFASPVPKERARKV